MNRKLYLAWQLRNLSTPFCTANVIDHVFPFSGSFLACGSNGGEGGCSILEDATATPISEKKIHLSGNVRPNSSPLKTDYVKNSICILTQKMTSSIRSTE